jgi:hypothetical protein
MGLSAKAYWASRPISPQTLVYNLRLPQPSLPLSRLGASLPYLPLSHTHRRCPPSPTPCRPSAPSHAAPPPWPPSSMSRPPPLLPPALPLPFPQPCRAALHSLPLLSPSARCLLAWQREAAVGRGVEAAAVVGTRRLPLPPRLRSTTSVVSSPFSGEIHAGADSSPSSGEIHGGCAPLSLRR